MSNTAIFKRYKITCTYTGDKESPMSDGNMHHSSVTVKNMNTKKSVVLSMWGTEQRPKFELEADIIYTFHCFLQSALMSSIGMKDFCAGMDLKYEEFDMWSKKFALSDVTKDKIHHVLDDDDSAVSLIRGIKALGTLGDR